MGKTASSFTSAELRQLVERRRSDLTIDLDNEGRVAEMLADIRLKMDALQLTQQDVAERCGWQQPQVAAYLTGAKEPGIANLAKLASAVGCVWRLTPAGRLAGSGDISRDRL